MKLRVLRVNSFADKPFSGNPATVCFLHEPASDDWMQNIAAEMNTGGTAFLICLPTRLRHEEALCGCGSERSVLSSPVRQ